jgi:hypothetical protein
MITQSILVNDIPQYKNTKAIDLYIEPKIFLNLFIKHACMLQENSTTVTIDERYNYRPDLLAYEQYGEDFWYPAILVANKLGSLLQFQATVLNHKCLIPHRETIEAILSEAKSTPSEFNEYIENYFKSAKLL